MQTFRATVAYDGTDYQGFQYQRERPTIQGELERALLRLTERPTRVKGAGRTDAGVHAYGQVISFQSDWRHGVAELQRALNAVLPGTIAVRDVALADARFHARFSAARRLYVYNLYVSPTRQPLLDRYALQVRETLDLARMREATERLVGTHDFAAFGQPTSHPEGEAGSTVRTIERAAWVVGEGALSGWLSPASGAEATLQFQIEGQGFLRGMVRRLVGTLLEVGRGQRPAEDVARLLEAKDIAQSAPPAPPCGLCLWQVTYSAAERRDEHHRDRDCPRAARPLSHASTGA